MSAAKDDTGRLVKVSCQGKAYSIGLGELFLGGITDVECSSELIVILRADSMEPKIPEEGAKDLTGIFNQVRGIAIVSRIPG